MTKFAIVENAKRQARMMFVGIAIPHQPSLADGVHGPIRSEKMLKFNRTALKNIDKRQADKIDPRMMGGEDRMIEKVGKPGSSERIAALAAQYASLADEEISPFLEND